MELRGEGVVVERQGVERLFHPAEVFGGQALQSVVPQGHQQPGVEVGGSVFDRPEMGGVQVAEIGGDLPDPVGFGGGSQTRLRGLRQIAREPRVAGAQFAGREVVGQPVGREVAKGRQHGVSAFLVVRSPPRSSTGRRGPRAAPGRRPGALHRYRLDAPPRQSRIREHGQSFEEGTPLRGRGGRRTIRSRGTACGAGDDRALASRGSVIGDGGSRECPAGSSNSPAPPPAPVPKGCRRVVDRSPRRARAPPAGAAGGAARPRSRSTNSRTGGRTLERGRVVGRRYGERLDGEDHLAGGNPSGCLLVQSAVTSELVSAMSRIRGAMRSSTCSQLSTTRRTCFLPSQPTMLSRNERRPRERDGAAAARWREPRPPRSARGR